MPLTYRILTKLIDVTVFPSVRIFYCPFFPLRGSLRIIICTDCVQYFMVLCEFEKKSGYYGVQKWILKIWLNLWIFTKFKLVSHKFSICVEEYDGSYIVTWVL